MTPQSVWHPPIRKHERLAAKLVALQRRGRLGKLIHRLMVARGTDIFSDRNIAESLLSMSKCPDMVINKGHYFGTSYFTEEPGLSPAEKADLIAFLKTM